MKSAPKIATTGAFKFVVGSDHAITFAGGGMPAALSTPSMIGVIERTARESLQPFVKANEHTVGMEIELRHLAPTLPGAGVTITRRVLHTDGREISFPMNARNTEEFIARGAYKRAVVRAGGLAHRAARKTG